MIEESTCYSVGTSLKNKSDATAYIESYLNMIKNKHNRYRVQVLHFDSGGKFASKRFATILKQYGI